MARLGRALWRKGSIVEAEELLREAVLMADTVLGPEHPQTLFANHYWASTLETL